MQLPIELCYIVIDNLDPLQASCRKTLCACSLACKALLHASRRRLYYRVNLFKLHTARLFTRTLRSSSLLPNPSSYVRHLSISGRPSWYGPSQRFNVVLCDLTTCLLDVTNLELLKFDWTHLDERSRSAMMTGFQNVKQLDIDDGIFRTPEEMSQFIATFPCLVHLSCYLIGWITHRAPLTTHLPLNLEQVDLSSDLATYFDQLFHMEQYPKPRTVRFWSIVVSDTASVDDLLRTLGLSIEHLDLGDVEELWFKPSYFGSAHGEALSSCINLSHNDNLRSIRVYCGSISRHFHPDWLSTLFSRITSPHMKVVRLCLSVSSVSELDRIDWHRMDQIFSQPQWAKLRKLEITLYTDPEPTEGWLELIKARLPRLASQGTRVQVLLPD